MVEVSKAQNDIPSAKRDGNDMARDVRNTIQLDENNSSRRATTTLRQETFLNEIEETLDEDDDSVFDIFEELRAECILLISTNTSNQSGKIESECRRRRPSLTKTGLSVGKLCPFANSIHPTWYPL